MALDLPEGNYPVTLAPSQGRGLGVGHLPRDDWAQPRRHAQAGRR
jgi:hypothetical protein